VTFEELKLHRIDPPQVWTAFGSPEDFGKLPQVHKDQIFFLDEEARAFLANYLSVSRMYFPPHSAPDQTGEEGSHWPFRYNYFKTIDKLSFLPEASQLKKWLFNRGIPFRTEVFVLSDDGHAVITTWKMVVKYAPEIFWRGDVDVFDRTLNWGLFFFHEDALFFGKDNINSGELDQKSMDEINRAKQLFPNAYFPY
jgi:hypothetical protein